MKNKSTRDMNSQRQQKPAMEKVLWTIICALPMVNFVEIMSNFLIACVKVENFGILLPFLICKSPQLGFPVYLKTSERKTNFLDIIN